MLSEKYQRAELEDYIFSEVRCIDEKRWNDWLSYFHDDGDYWIPLEENQSSPQSGLSIMYEDKITLHLRCTRYGHPQIHSQIPASGTCHLISNVMLDYFDEENHEYLVNCRFNMQESRRQHTISWAGTINYHLMQLDDKLLIKRKKVLLINQTAALDTIHIPF